jgi:rhodanese-related sulfurtransferase
MSDPTEPLGLDALVADARRRLHRLAPAEAARAVAEDGALLVDIRPEGQRRREGEIPGAVIIDRNVLEWRLAPRSEHRIPELRDADQAIIVFCSAGYASSLAAASLQRLGLRGATDLDGGFGAWEAAGLPAVSFGVHHPRIDRTAPVHHNTTGAAIRSA